MRRRADWPEKLAALIEERRFAEFVWGVHDCAMFAADAVERQTGIDPLAQWRGAYNNEETGALILGGVGIPVFMDAALRAYGFEPVAPNLARRGDFVIIDVANMPTCGVHLGATVAAPGLVRLHFLPSRLIREAWAI